MTKVSETADDDISATIFYEKQQKTSIFIFIRKAKQKDKLRLNQRWQSFGTDFRR